MSSVEHQELGLEQTVAAAAETLDAAAATSAPALSLTRTSDTATTVLPDVECRDGKMVLVPRDQLRYATERVIGEGGMGVVELARDADIGRSVAIKRLRAQRSSPAALARFVDEVRTIGRLDHPGIAPIHDVGVDADGAFFFVMKYIDGETLEDIIERLRAGDADTHAQYPFDRRISIFLSMLHSLEYAHSAKLLHRDLKPANIMIGEFGEVLLMDWGIARPIGGAADEAAPQDEEGDEGGDGRSRLVSTRVGSVVGTPLYMSPEQARGETDTLDARSDLYSAGAVLLEFLTLRHPLEDERTVGAICAELQTLEPPSIVSSFWDHPTQAPVPAELRHFLRKALANDREARWPSIGEMLAELERVRSGDFRVQCPVTFMKQVQYRSLPFIDRHPVGANVGAVLFVATFLTSLVGFLYLLLTG